MSVDATKWAWSAPVESASQRVVLLALADRAGEEHTCWPSTVRVQKDTCLDLKTVKATITRLIELGLLCDTGARKGSTGRVRVLRLIGVNGREQMNPKTESFQKRNDSENGSLNEPKNGTMNRPKNGSQNLSENLPKNLSVKSDAQDVKSFVPDLTVLNDMLKAGMAKPVTQNQLEQVLIEFIPWYETKHMTHNQRMAKLFAWIKKDQGAVSNNRSSNQTLQSSAAEPEFVKPSAPVKRGPTPEQLAEQKRQADEFLENMRNGGAA